MVNIYIESDLKGVRGDARYGYVLEWERGQGKPAITREGFGALSGTRNRVFLAATLEAFGRIRGRGMRIDVYEPCPYVTGAASRGLLELWQLHAWVKGDGQGVKHRDLWEPLMALAGGHDIKWHDGPHRYSEWIQHEIRRAKAAGEAWAGAGGERWDEAKEGEQT